MFQLKVPISELRNPGKYKVWVQQAFGFAVNSTEHLQLPTSEYPVTFEVVESSWTMAIAATLGVFFVLVLVSLGLYAVKHRAPQNSFSHSSLRGDLAGLQRQSSSLSLFPSCTCLSAFFASDA